MGRLNGVPRQATSNFALYDRIKKPKRIQVIPLKEAKARLIADLREQGKLA